MYALCLYHAVCYLALLFSCFTPDMIYTISTILHYAFHLSAYFLSSCPSLPVLHPDHDIMMHRQSVKIYRTYPRTTVPGWQGLIKAGIRVFFSPSYKIVEQWYAYLLNLNENTPGQYICL